MHPRLYRRRYIPDEIIELKDDEIIRLDENILLTKWNCLKPRSDIHRGVSCVYFDRNIKVSKVYDADNRLVYYYCDIIMAEWKKDEDALIIHDLLADVLVMPDGYVKVLDIGELPEALEKGLIDVAMLNTALRALDELLAFIYEGKISSLTKLVDEVE